MPDQPPHSAVPLSDEDKRALHAAVEHIARSGLQAPLDGNLSFPPDTEKSQGPENTHTDQ